MSDGVTGRRPYTVTMTYAVIGLVGLVLAAPAQIPDAPKNLQFFPSDTPRSELIQRMREFSFALGVRCQHCHTGGDGISFEGVVFESDDKPAKRKARFMLRMVEELNGTVLARVPSRSAPPVRVACVTCHRGLPIPRTLADVLTEVVDTDGPAAAVARYRELRQESMVLGTYDFGEWSVNELARELRESGKSDAAVAMLEMNGEYYPESTAIDLALASLHESRDERDRAIARYRRALEKDPDHRFAKERLAALEGRQQ